MLENLSLDVLDDLHASELEVLLDIYEGVPKLWKPQGGPQMVAYWSPADQIFYGGAAGGGKSDLLLGLAGTKHNRSIIFRREYPQLRAIIERSREIFSRPGLTHLKDSYNESLHLWRLADGRQIEFGSIQQLKHVNKYKGRPHDFIGFDEVPDFLEEMFRFVIGWLRSTDPNQRCRVVAAGNPPTDPEGEWVIKLWRPWLDDQHPNKARPGELRWFAMVDGKEIEVEDRSPIQLQRGPTIYPVSRTFIPALLTDNIFLSTTGYASTLAALPEPLRSQLLFGNFKIGRKDHEWQIIPTAWVEAAQQRWQEQERPGKTKLTAIGLDVARGGNDQTVISPRRGNWFEELKAYPGSDTPDGPTAAGLALQELDEETVINVDVIGVGASAYDWLRSVGIPSNGVNFGGGSDATDRSGRLRFANKRAECWWRMREALDPMWGDNICLPPDRELLVDLTAPRWLLRSGRILVEEKDEVKKRIGRSPDRGDAAVLSLSYDLSDMGGIHV